MSYRFSVVITTYNRLEWLKKALASVLAQTIACDVVVVDDASDDGTAAYMENIQRQWGDRLIYYRQPRNLGHAAAVNQGVNLATGSWIKLLDDDDYLAPDCLQEIDRAISQHPQAVICSVQAYQVTDQREHLSCTRPVGPGSTVYIAQADIHYGMLLEMVPFGTPVQVAFSKDAFRRSQGWDSQFDTNYDDIDSWLKIAQFGDAIFINKPLAYRTVWPGGLNQRFSFQERLRINTAIKDKIYNLVHPSHRLPARQDVHRYLQLHWGLVALRNRQVTVAWSILRSAVFSLGAWQLLLARKFSKRSRIYQILSYA